MSLKIFIGRQFFSQFKKFYSFIRIAWIVDYLRVGSTS